MKTKPKDKAVLLQRIKISRIVMFIGYSLFLFYFYNAWVAQGYDRHDIAVLLVKVSPLLIFLPGLIKANGIAHIFLGVVLLVYALKAIVDLVDDPYLFMNIFQITALLMLFSSNILFLRWRAEYRKLEENNQDDH